MTLTDYAGIGAAEAAADEILDKAIELSLRADRILATLPAAIGHRKHQQRRQKLVDEAAELHRQASVYYDAVDSLDD